MAYYAHAGYTTLAGTNNAVITLNLPAGKYLLSASAELFNVDISDGSTGYCQMPGYKNDREFLDGNDTRSLSLTSAITHPGGAVVLNCAEVSADVDIYEAALTALKVDSIG